MKKKASLRKMILLKFCRISGSKESINLEYAPYLRNRIVEPLLKDGSDGAKSALEMLHEYDLLKEDLDSLNEICSWPNSVDPMSKIDSKVGYCYC